MPSEDQNEEIFQPGTIIYERYQLQRKLGQAFSRQTWLAQDLNSAEHLPSQIVIKLLLGGNGLQWEHFKLFEREANVLKQLEHSRIPTFRDFFDLPNHPAWCGLVEDFIPGHSLKEVLANGKRFNEDETRRIATEILEVLIYLHELNPCVLHRDLKPSNLILGNDHQIHVIDFGAVQAQLKSEGGTLTVVGTAGFAPMEQFLGRSLPASDLYSLGATLINLMTGLPPTDLLQSELKLKFRDRISVSEQLKEWLECLTELSPDKRFQSAREALSTLESGAMPAPKPLASTALLSKPRRSRIQVHQDPFSLDILIPQVKMNVWRTLVLLFFGGITLLWTLIISPLFLFGESIDGIIVIRFFFAVMTVLLIVLFLLLIHTSIAEVRVEFNREWMQIHHSWLGQRYLSRRRISIDDILYLTVFHKSALDWNVFDLRNQTVMIRTRKGSFQFVRLLRRSECDWLVSTIQAWLN